MNIPNETEGIKRRGRPATGQAKTAAQRMQERRQRMKHGETGDRDRGGEREITVVLTLTALNALRRLAKRDGVTQKQFLDALLRDTEDKLLQGFDEAELEQYLSDTEKVAVVADEITGIPVIQEVPETEPEKSRICDPAPNKRNKSGYVGVSFHKKSGKWQAQCRENGKPKALGLFDTPEEAHRAREAYLAKRDSR